MLPGLTMPACRFDNTVSRLGFVIQPLYRSLWVPISRQHRLQIEKRRQDISALYLQQKTQVEIAVLLGMDQQLVSYDLKAIHARWLKEAVQNLDERKALELQKIDAVEREAWAAWERSQAPRKITLTESTEGGESILENGTRVPKSPLRKASVRREGQGGDPRFLERIQKCIDQRCAILGVGAQQDALKQAAGGLAALLDEARQQRPVPEASSAPPMAEA